MSNFNNQLKTLRQETGLSQQELANKIGISKSSINMYERGEREPGIETLKRMADFFNVDIDYLLGKSQVKRKTVKIKNYSQKVIAKNIQNLRKEANMSKSQLADLLNVKETVVANIESGKVVPDKDTIFNICDIFHTTPDFLDGSICDYEENGDLDAEYRFLNRKQLSPDQLQLTEGEKMLLDLFRQIPEGEREMFVEVLRARLKNPQ